MFPEMVDLTPFREVLTNADARRTFLVGIDLGEQWPKWGPHLQALDELLLSEIVATEVKELLDELVKRDPDMAMRLLAVCQEDSRKYRVGALVAQAIASELQAVPAEIRAQVEQSFLSWAIEREQDSWDIDSDAGEFSALNVRWRMEDIAFDLLPPIVWKLVGVLHARMMDCTADIGFLLRKFNWCMTVAKGFPAHHSRSPAALKLVAAGRVPRSLGEAGRVLKTPVVDIRALDDGILAQFGLPLWPSFSASWRDGKVELSNVGVGAALAVGLSSAIASSDGDTEPPTFDMASGQSVLMPLSDGRRTVGLRFEKFGQTYQTTLEITDEKASAILFGNLRTLPATISRKRLAAQRKHRKTIDPQGMVVGLSSALLEVFEGIYHANVMDGPSAVLLLGEPGVGKTHIAKLLHDSSNRAARLFKVVNAGGGGGDINIQRGEWIGYGKGHGIQGVDKNGRAGHLMNANGGTLFVDEFAALSHDLQVIFLSVLEKRSIEKIGGESFTPDVRCIFATNTDVEEAVTNGLLRRDLLDRIPVKLHIPPLRDRLGDILLLARFFAAGRAISDRCLVALLRYNWPGNVRELRNKMTAATAKQESDGAAAIDVAHVEVPAAIVAAVEAMDDDSCRRELWTVADEIARDEGFEHGTGLQRRAGEIMGVGEAQASKMYRALGLTIAASA